MTGLTMLDGKRYYTVFPDEDPELRPRIRAVLDALGNLDKAFRQSISAKESRPALRGQPILRCFAVTDLASPFSSFRSDPGAIAQLVSHSAFEYRQIDIIAEHRVLTVCPGRDRRSWLKTSVGRALMATTCQRLASTLSLMVAIKAR
jgi:hypothetical protein